MRLCIMRLILGASKTNEDDYRRFNPLYNDNWCGLKQPIKRNLCLRQLDENNSPVNLLDQTLISYSEYYSNHLNTEYFDEQFKYVMFDRSSAHCFIIDNPIRVEKTPWKLCQDGILTDAYDNRGYINKRVFGLFLLTLCHHVLQRGGALIIDAAEAYLEPNVLDYLKTFFNSYQSWKDYDNPSLNFPCAYTTNLYPKPNFLELTGFKGIHDFKEVMDQLKSIPIPMPEKPTKKTDLFSSGRTKEQESDPLLGDDPEARQRGCCTIL